MGLIFQLNIPLAFECTLFATATDLINEASCNEREKIPTNVKSTHAAYWTIDKVANKSLLRS